MEAAPGACDGVGRRGKQRVSEVASGSWRIEGSPDLVFPGGGDLRGALVVPHGVEQRERES